MSNTVIYPPDRLKYHSTRTWSNLCGRYFDSKAECARGEDLALLERAGEIADLQYQVRFVLNEKPKISITIDFAYNPRLTSDPILERAGDDSKKIQVYGSTVYEDTKGVLTRDFRTKLAWLKEKHGIGVRLTG